jgi:hypothetical protein
MEVVFRKGIPRHIRPDDYEDVYGGYGFMKFTRRMTEAEYEGQCILSSHERDYQMKRISLVLMLLVIVPALAGCRSQQLQRDQVAIRETLLDLETNQIMDNLIRIRNNMPILHVDYNKLISKVTQKRSGEVGGSYQDVIAGAITRGFSPEVSGEQNQELSMEGEPIRGKPEIYLAYIDYAKKDDYLCVTSYEPTDAQSHLCVKKGDLYFWVPMKRAHDFFELSVQVMGLRQDLSTELEPLILTILGVTGTYPELPLSDDQVEEGYVCDMTIKLSAPLDMNQVTTGVVLVAGNIIELVLLPNPNTSLGQPTDELRIEYEYGSDVGEGQIPVPPHRFIEKIAGEDVTFDAQVLTSTPPSQEVLLQELNRNVERLYSQGVRDN